MVSEVDQPTNKKEEEIATKRVSDSRETANHNKLNRLNSMAYHSNIYTHRKKSHFITCCVYTRSEKHNPIHNFTLRSGIAQLSLPSTFLFETAAERENAAANLMEIDLFILVSMSLFTTKSDISHKRTHNNGAVSALKTMTLLIQIIIICMAQLRKSKTKHVFIYLTNAFSLSILLSFSFEIVLAKMVYTQAKRFENIVY